MSRRLSRLRPALHLAFCLAPLATQGESLDPAADAESLAIRYCFECHGDGVSKGDFALDGLMAESLGVEQAMRWKKAWKIVRHEFMPPTGADRPSDAERKALVEWIETAKLGVDREHPDPGRVTARRLNRMEYEYTVTDLFGVDVRFERTFSGDAAEASLRLRDRLPHDDTAFGFDNIGDFQSLSPALLETYFLLAEDIVDAVIVQEGRRYPKLEVMTGDLEVTKAKDESESTRHVATLDLDREGSYQLKVQFATGGWREFGGAYTVALAVGEKRLMEEIVKVGGHEVHIHTHDLELTAGSHELRLSTKALEPDFEGRYAPLELRPTIVLTGPLDEESYVHPESHRRVFFAGDPPQDESARGEYARAIMQRVADRAFRRPVEADQLDGLTEIVMRHPSFKKGVGEALMAILTAPQFLFRTELQPRPDDPSVVHPLDDYALASRLSYLLWLSLPDEELTRLAAEGALRPNLRSQVERMLADPKAQRFFEDFPGQWLRTRNVLMTPISRRSDDVDPVRKSMKEETERLFEYIARNDRDLLELVTADYSFLDKRLAEYYGIEGVSPVGMEKVALPPDSRRGGILTHGSFLVASSNPNRTSPVKRGLFVLENLLGIEPPPPPANIPPLDEARANDGVRPRTVREQLALHREDRSCAACHAHFDPIGIALENYDVIGRWRDEESGQPIRPEETTVTGEKLSGIDDLKALFVNRKDRFYHCVTEKLLTYALGRGLEPSDAVTVEHIAARVEADGGKFSTLLMEIIESPAFRMRRGDDGQAREAQMLALPKPPPPEERKGRRRRGPRDRDRDRDRDAERPVRRAAEARAAAEPSNE